MANRTVREALTLARDIMLSRTADPRVSGVDQGQCQASADACDAILVDLPASNIFPAGQRNARASQLENRVTATIGLEQKYKFPATEFYDALDLMADSATVIRAGIANFDTVLG